LGVKDGLPLANWAFFCGHPEFSNR
jgi:hypothetical protein